MSNVCGSASFVAYSFVTRISSLVTIYVFPPPMVPDRLYDGRTQEGEWGSPHH
jgi:hypothetical protein